MTLVDKFVCRREGHDPALKITMDAGLIHSYVMTCKRCGKTIEIKASAA